MGYKNKIILFFVFLSLFITKCGYIENDGKDFNIEVLGNVEIYKQQNDKIVNLIFNETPNISAIIVENCSVVYFEKRTKKIFVESEINDFNSKYFEINILNENENQIFKGVKKVEITHNSYLKNILGVKLLYANNKIHNKKSIN
jgi:hypothetical protein